MEPTVIETLRYPTGKLKFPESYIPSEIKRYIDIIQKFPGEIKSEVSGCDEQALGYLHRPGGWTIRQLVHHCADSHMNAFVRIKLALTEDTPTIKPYEENEWVKLTDTTEAPVEWSLQIIEGMHKRWALLSSGLNEAQLQRAVFHPEMKREINISSLLCMYSWHCRHHLEHIRNAKKYKNKF